MTPAFMEFINSKKVIADNFHIKSTIRNKTSHEYVINVLSDLLEAAKYDMKTLNKNPKFRFEIYDLIRCKTHRKTG
jgi:hypothetical protein